MGCVEMNLVTLINSFMKLILEEKIEVYNEFSLQHELGIFLRNELTNYKIQFERNTKFFNINQLKYICGRLFLHKYQPMYKIKADTYEEPIQKIDI